MKSTIKHNKKNKFGQYFTPKIIANFMIELADISSKSKILEPSCGAGVFLELFQQKGYKDLTAYEIDKHLSVNFPFVKHESFISAEIEEKFDLIIGNPPYIRWKNLEEELKQELSTNSIWNKYFNSLCDYLYIFILKSIELLKPNGQLIFICPEYWMNTTNSVSLRNYMVSKGYFEEIYHFNETPIFDKVTASIIIFKFIKIDNTTYKNNIKNIKFTKYYSNKKLTLEKLDNIKNKIDFEGVEYLNVPQFKINERWLLQTNSVQQNIKKIEQICQKKYFTNSIYLFEMEKVEYHTIGEICDIGNGLVSGLDKAFQLNGEKLNKNEKYATIDVVKAKNLTPYFAQNTTKYIFIKDEIEKEEAFQEMYPNFYNHFQKYKFDLQKRYQYSRKINYWEWVFLRNINLFNKNEKRIFVPCKERISNKNYFRFALVEPKIYPTQDVTAIFKKSNTKESIEYILAYLNQPFVFEWLKSNGIVKGNIVEFSEKPITSIPFKKINWNNENEVFLHNSISEKTSTFLKDKNEKWLLEIKKMFNQIFENQIV